MAENEKVLEPQTAPENEKPSKGKNFKANSKEWFRKKIVGLKRAPQKIALVFLAITTIYFMFALYSISQAIYRAYDEVQAAGICVFITTLLSLLVLVSFLNAFPKRKKPNIFFIVLVFVMIAAMVACDIVCYVEMADCLKRLSNTTSEMYQLVKAAQPYVIVHVVFLGISALVFALLPLYKKLILKINTKVELESATENMQGEIDIQED